MLSSQTSQSFGWKVVGSFDVSAVTAVAAVGVFQTGFVQEPSKVAQASSRTLVMTRSCRAQHAFSNSELFQRAAHGLS